MYRTTVREKPLQIYCFANFVAEKIRLQNCWPHNKKIHFLRCADAKPICNWTECQGNINWTKRPHSTKVSLTFAFYLHFFAHSLCVWELRSNCKCIWDKSYLSRRTYSTAFERRSNEKRAHCVQLYSRITLFSRDRITSRIRWQNSGYKGNRNSNSQQSGKYMQTIVSKNSYTDIIDRKCLCECLRFFSK